MLKSLHNIKVASKWEQVAFSNIRGGGAPRRNSGCDTTQTKQKTQQNQAKNIADEHNKDNDEMDEMGEMGERAHRSTSF